MTTSYTAVQKGRHVRVWLSLNGLSPDTTPVLEGYIVPDSVSFNQNVEIVKKKVPSTTRRGHFDTISTVVQRSDPEITTSLINRLPADMRSLFIKLSLSGCKFDMVLAYGVCSEPNIYNDFDKLEVFEGVSVTGYSHDATGAFDETTLTDDVLENIEVSADNYYEFAKPTQRVALDAGADTVLAVRIADTQSCGDSSDGCTEQERSDGCQKVFALSDDATNPSIHYSKDGGQTWVTEVTNISSVTYTAVDINSDGTNIIVTGSGSDTALATYYYVSIDDFEAAGGGGVTMTAVSDAGQHPGGKIWVGSGEIFFAGAAGQLLSLPLSQVGAVPVAVPGTYAAVEFADIHGLSDDYVVAVGDAGQVVIVSFGTGSDSGADVTGTPSLVGVHAKEEAELVVLSSTGLVFYSVDAGKTWAQAVDLGTTGYSLTFANQAVGYAVVDTYLYLTADGGASWARLSNTAHNASAGTVSACDQGNMVVYNGANTVMAAEDQLRQVYGAV